MSITNISEVKSLLNQLEYDIVNVNSVHGIPSKTPTFKVYPSFKSNHMLRRFDLETSKEYIKYPQTYLNVYPSSGKYSVFDTEAETELFMKLAGLKDEKSNDSNKSMCIVTRLQRALLTIVANAWHRNILIIDPRSSTSNFYCAEPLDKRHIDISDEESFILPEKFVYDPSNHPDLLKEVSEGKSLMLVRNPDDSFTSLLVDPGISIQETQNSKTSSGFERADKATSPVVTSSSSNLISAYNPAPSSSSASACSFKPTSDKGVNEIMSFLKITVDNASQHRIF